VYFLAIYKRKGFVVKIYIVFIGIVADEGLSEGGNNQIIRHLSEALNQSYTVQIEFIKIEKYYPRYLPVKWKDVFRFLFLRRVSKANFEKYDLIITLQPTSHCVRHRRHLVYFQHHLKQYYDLFGQTLKKRKGLRKKLVFLIVTLCIRGADKFYLTPNLKRSYVVSNSETVSARLKKYNKLSVVQVVNPGCDILGPEPASEAESKESFILSFSRLSITQKGIDLIIEAAKLLPKLDFVIAGPYDVEIESLAQKKLPSNVEIRARRFSYSEKAELFRCCSVFLAPYIQEDFGIAPLEANSCGKPVVYCTDSGEIVHTQKHLQTGYQCNRDPSQLAQGIRYCVQNKGSMRESCVSNAETYSWNKFEASFQAIVKDFFPTTHIDGIA
jgi:glycosyltransferase involved in cell wall biosynthesis